VEVLTRKTNTYMVIILVIAYGAVAGLIGLTFEDYNTARPSYHKETE
jgi:hypothetical protein